MTREEYLLGPPVLQQKLKAAGWDPVDGQYKKICVRNGERGCAVTLTRIAKAVPNQGYWTIKTVLHKPLNGMIILTTTVSPQHLGRRLQKLFNAGW